MEQTNFLKIKKSFELKRFENDLESQLNEDSKRTIDLKQILERIENKEKQTNDNGVNNFFNKLNQYSYKKQWNRLQLCHKIIKLEEYCDTHIKNKKNKKEIKTKLLEMANDRLLNTKKMVEYDLFQEKIININCLEYKDDIYFIKKI